jgi:Zn-dependent protease with chaperone function
MNREQFDKLVHAVENGVGKNPVTLRWRVAWWAAVGYALLLAGLFLVVLLAGAFFAVMFWADSSGRILCGIAGTIILIGGSWAVLKALLIRLPPPKGTPVARAEAQRLFSLLDELRGQLRSVPFHEVLLVPEHNAAVVQVPRLGVLGWSRNYLLLGLPLLDAHSPEEVRAILAHEFAHLSRAHGRFSHWIYRLRRSWEQVFHQFSRPRVQGEVSLRPIVVKCVDYFWPRFNAHAFVLSRANEYEADALAARLAGPHHLASALTRSALQDHVLDQKFWPDIWQMATSEPAPPKGVFTRLRDSLREEPPAPDRAKWTAEAFRRTTTNADTHPCLTDRLRALDRLPSGPLTDAPPSARAPEPSAAEDFFGASLSELRQRVEDDWRKGIAKNWEARHAKANALTHRLSALEQATATKTSDAEGLWDKACVLLDLKGDKEAEPLLRQVLALRPDHLPATFHLGRILLDDGRDEGEALLERAVAEDEELAPQVCSLLHVYFRRAGLTGRLRELDARMDAYEKNLAASRAERREVTARDTLIPHALLDDELRVLHEALAGEAQLYRAWLARKELRHFPKQKLFLLCVQGRPAWHRLPNADRNQSLVNTVSKRVQLPGRVLVFSRSAGFGALARKLERFPAAEIFSATSGRHNPS